MFDLECERTTGSELRLFYRNGRGELRSFSLEGRARTTVGRGIACEVILDDTRVSRRHASIELVDEQHHLLRDEGSSNGTFLNGLRVEEGHCFSLRDGDVIEVGGQRLVYGRTPDVAATPAPSFEGSAFALEDLLRDGYAALEPHEKTALQVSIQAAFESVPRRVGVERSLVLVAEELGADVAAGFLEQPGAGLRPVAARPTAEAAGSLVAVANRAFKDRQGRLLLAVPLAASVDPRETLVQGLDSVAAVPVMKGNQALGALAVQRSGGERLDRSDLARLAVLGDRLGHVLAAERTGSDTRPSFLP